MYQDETLKCEDCGKEFVFSTGEQEFYAEKGLVNKPKRCPECRKERRQKKTEEECMRQFVHNAALRQKFLLNLLRAKKSIARNAIKNDKVNLMFKISSHLLKVAFLILNQSQRVF